jgi:hypothetical protein
MRSTARDMVILQELLMEFARAFFSRLPDSPADDDPDLRAAVEATLTRAPLEVPEPSAHEAYAQPYARFRNAFPAARPDLLSHG